MKILITGSNGYVGRSLSSGLEKKYEITKISREELDLTDSIQTRAFFKDKFFDVVIHCAVSGGSRLREDTIQTLDCNLKMYYNLLDNSNHYNKFIHLGSGAEIYLEKSPYGMSKKIIRESILGKEKFYNLRIFAVFDENEIETRFIKTSIKNYLERKPIEIFQNKRMDFIYMEDLITLIIYYIENNPPKEIDCIYERTFTLSEIASMINSLEDHTVPVNIIDEKTGDYRGNFKDLGLNFIGLEEAIRKNYIKIVNKK